MTSIGPSGAPVGTTASAVTSLSLTPPLLLVCLERRSETLRALRTHGAFAINVLAEVSRSYRPISRAAVSPQPGSGSSTASG